MKTAQIEEKCMSTSSLDYDEWTQIKVFMKEWYDMEIHETEKRMAFLSCNNQGILITKVISPN